MDIAELYSSRFLAQSYSECQDFHFALLAISLFLLPLLRSNRLCQYQYSTSTSEVNLRGRSDREVVSNWISIAGSIMASDKFEEVESNYYAKCLQIILESRIPFFTYSTHPGEDSTISNASSGSDSKGCWFNLLLGEFDPGLDKLEPWRIRRRKPMVIDILLSQSNGGRTDRPSGAATSSGQRHTSAESKSSFENAVDRNVDLSTSSSECTSVLERWVVQLESLVGTGSQFSQISTHPLDSSTVYTRTLIMLRSLYCTARLLPAHNLFRNACSSRMCTFSLSYRMLVSSPPLSEYENMKDIILHNFTPVKSLYGRMCLSVVYRTKIPVASFESAPISAQIISDYVGSPATNPSQSISNDWHSKARSGRRDVHLLSVPELGQNSPASFYNDSRVNNAHFMCETLVFRNEEEDFIAPDFINDNLSTQLPATISIRSGGCAGAEDEELLFPFAVDKRLSDRESRGAAIGKLQRMFESAAPLSCTLQYPSRTRSGKSLKPLWRNADRGFSTCLLEKDEINAPCAFDAESIYPVSGKIEHQPKMTSTNALEELQMYKELRDSLLNPC